MEEVCDSLSVSQRVTREERGETFQRFYPLPLSNGESGFSTSSISVHFLVWVIGRVFFGGGMGAVVAFAQKLYVVGTKRVVVGRERKGSSRNRFHHYDSKEGKSVLSLCPLQRKEKAQ